MKIPLRSLLCHGLIGVCALLATKRAVAGTLTQRVINIEAAMRSWQEHYHMISPFTAYWEARSDLIEPGLYPEDGFYGQDLLDPEKAAFLVDNLYSEMQFNLFSYLKTPADGNIISLSAATGYSLNGIPRPTAANYVSVFTQLVEILNGLNVYYKTAPVPSSIISRKFGAAGSGSRNPLDCDQVKALILSRWDASASGATTSSLIFRRQILTWPATSFLDGSMETRTGRFSYDLSRFTGAAKHYVRTIQVVNSARSTIFGNYALSEPAVVGATWISKEFGWKTGDITAMTISCPTIGTAVRLEEFVEGLIIVLPIYTYTISDLWAEVQVCQACAANCTAGSMAFSNDCINAQIQLGKDSSGRAGFLQIKAEAPSRELSTPWSLQRHLRQGMSALVDQSQLNAAKLPLPRQYLIPQGAVDVVVLDEYAYELRFYSSAQIGPKDASGFHTFSGTPSTVVKVENPDHSVTTYNRLKFTVTGTAPAEVADYSYDASTNGWTMARTIDGKTRTEVRSSTFVSAANQRIETHTVVDENGHTVMQERNTYQVFPWNTGSNALLPEELVETVVDPDGEALKTTYAFYSDQAVDGLNYGHVKLQVNPNGFWQKFEYDAAGRVTRLTTPFLNSPVGAVTGVRIRYTVWSDTFPNETRVESVVLAGGTTELRRAYRNFDYDETTSITARTAGAAWDAPGNIVSISRTDDTGELNGRITADFRSDGTGTLYSYQSNADGSFTTTASSGALNATKSAVTTGSRSVTTVSKTGELIDERVYDFVSGLLVSMRAVTQTDSFGRATRIDYLDGTHEVRSYACCGLEYVIDREGIRTDYGYDSFKRLEQETRVGITTRYTYDGAGRRVTTTREGGDGSAILRESNTYDLTGRLLSTTAAGGRTTTFDETTDATGQTLRTTTGPDGATRRETLALDGTLLLTDGTAVAPTKYDYGADTDGYFSKVIKVGSGGEETEWVKTYTDMLGHTTKTAYADGASSALFYDSLGRLVRQVDPDGVATLFAYNSQGEQEVVATDVDGNGAIGFAGTDRVSRTRSEVGTRDGITVQRSTTEIWQTNGQDVPTVVSVAEVGAGGLHSWQTTNSLTASSVIAYDGAGGRTVTSVAPDGSKTIQAYFNGRLTSTASQTPSGGQLGATAYGYDPHGRLHTSTDARNGATTYAYFADDKIQSVTTPDPDPARTGPGYDPQATSFTYDAAGRPDTVTQPDSGVVHTSYYPTGAVKRTWGSRTYPVEYTYDAQGRRKTQTTWKDFSGDSGKAVTTWNYNALRGWLDNKRYQDNTGPSYTYKASGRLLTRTWARGIVTTYAYNAAGDLSGTTYSDGTTAVGIVYDRSGRSQTVTDASGSRTLSYDPSGQLKDEDYTTGLLNNLGVHRTFDSLSRLGSVSALSATSVLNQIGYAYDDASRLNVVTQGTNTATYTYVPNSPLVQSVTFAQGGATRLTTTKAYDNLNRLSSVTNTPSVSSVQSVAYSYDSANQRTRATREDSAYWDYAYDALGQVTSGRKFLPGDVGVLGHAFGWTYDDIGNRKTETRNGRLSGYAANLLNQYDQRTMPGAFDVLGESAIEAKVTTMFPVPSTNITATQRQGTLFYNSQTVANATAPVAGNVGVTAVKNLVGPNGEDLVAETTRAVFVAKNPEIFAYDADGNLTSDARWRYTWDAENRLVAVETNAAAVTAGVAKQKLEFAYDGQSRRVAKKVSNWNGSAWLLASHTLFLYDGWNLLAELNALSANSVVRTYAWGLDLSGSLQGAGGVGGLLFANVSTAPGLPLTAHSACFDGNGNIIAYVDMATGNRSATYEYDAFGETLITDGIAATLFPFRFSTRYTDSETGIIMFPVRPYLPWLGRFGTNDPIEEQGGLDLYGFVANNPINAIDPLGRDAVYVLDTDNAAAAGQGHGGALIGDDTRGWTYYSFAPQIGPNSTVKNYKTLADAVKDSEISRYEKFLRFTTSRQDDNRAKLKAGELFDKGYSPFSRNCGHIAGDIIKAAKPSFKVDSWRPKVVYSDNEGAADARGNLNALAPTPKPATP